MSRLFARIGENVGGWFCRVHPNRMLVRVNHARGDRYAGKVAYCPDCLGAASARLDALSSFPGARPVDEDGLPDRGATRRSGNDERKMSLAAGARA